MIRVLLVAPLDPDVPGNLKFLMGGENTYTRNLLKYPPKGVKYVHYEEALRLGEIEYLGIGKILGFLVKFRILPLSPGSKCFKVKERFDLVHCHIYSLKISGAAPPVILSDSSANYLFLKYYVGWHQWRIKIGYFLKKHLFNWLEVLDADTNLLSSKKLVVFSEFAKKIHLRLGADKKKLEVIPPGLPSFARHPGSHEVADRISKSVDSIVLHTAGLQNDREDRVNILFVGIWFVRKGGPDVVRAFKLLAKKYKNIYLTIVGPVPKDISVNHRRIKQTDFVPREKLIKEYYPRADIFVIIPPQVEGFGFAVLEAMSFAIPCIVSNVCALPELVENGENGFVIDAGNFDQLVEKLETLISQGSLRNKLGEEARKKFEKMFSIEKANKRLLSVYKESIGSG